MSSTRIFPYSKVKSCPREQKLSLSLAEFSRRKKRATVIPLALRLHSLINISVKLSSLTSPVNLPCVCVCVWVRVYDHSHPELLSGDGCFTDDICFYFFTPCAGHYERFLIPWTGRSMGKFQSKLGEMIYNNSALFFKDRGAVSDFVLLLLFLSLSGQHRNADRTLKVNGCWTNQILHIVPVLVRVSQFVLLFPQVVVWLPMCRAVRRSRSKPTSSKPNWQR